MLSEGISDQLSRIGGVAATAIILAAALATFAILQRLIAPAAPAPAPRTERPATVGVSPAPPGTAAASAVGATGPDPLTQAAIRSQRELTRSEHQAVVLARQRAAAVNRSFSTLARTNQSATSVTRGAARTSSGERGAHGKHHTKAQ